MCMYMYMYMYMKVYMEVYMEMCKYVPCGWACARSQLCRALQVRWRLISNRRRRSLRAPSSDRTPSWADPGIWPWATFHTSAGEARKKQRWPFMNESRFFNKRTRRRRRRRRRRRWTHRLRVPQLHLLWVGVRTRRGRHSCRTWARLPTCWALHRSLRPARRAAVPLRREGSVCSWQWSASSSWRPCALHTRPSLEYMWICES